VLKAIEEISATKKRLKIEIPAEIVEGELQKALKEIQKKAKIQDSDLVKHLFNYLKKIWQRC